MATDSSSTGRKNPNPNPNPTPSKLVMAFHFLRALSIVHHTHPRSSRALRIRRIQSAAYASMAYSAGSRRAWSRALLHNLRCRARRRYSWSLSTAGARRRPISVVAPPRRETVTAGSRALEPQTPAEGALRRLVPGGSGMDYCSLLEETADYIKCLSMQVNLMQSIVDSVPPPCGRR